MKITYAAKGDAGMKRAQNHDCLGLIEEESLFIVALEGYLDKFVSKTTPGLVVGVENLESRVAILSGHWSRHLPY